MSAPTLSDLIGELAGMSTKDLRALIRAAQREIETREKTRRML